MKFGVGIDYSIKALLALAERYPSSEPLRVEDMAANQGIPENYLRRLLIELKRGGLVASQKGPSGGYLLARHPARITVADVVEIIGGDYLPADCLEEGGDSACARVRPCPARHVWREVREAVGIVLRRATLQSLADRHKAAHMYAI